MKFETDRFKRLILKGLGNDFERTRCPASKIDRAFASKERALEITRESGMGLDKETRHILPYSFSDRQIKRQDIYYHIALVIGTEVLDLDPEYPPPETRCVTVSFVGSRECSL